MSHRSQSYRNAALTNTKILVKGAGTAVTGWALYNVASDDAWVHLYNAAATADVTVGTTAPKHSLLVPAGDGTKYSKEVSDLGVILDDFPLGLVIVATKGVGNSTAPTSAVVANLRYL